MGIADLRTAAAGFLADPAFGTGGVSVTAQAPTPPGGSAPPPITFNGIFEELVNEPLRLVGYAESTDRRSTLECPTVIDNEWPGYTTNWSFTINGETWYFDGFDGRDADLVAVKLVTAGQNKITGGRST